MTYFEKNLINNLNVIQKANDILGINTFNPDTIHDIVIKTLVDCKINFFEDGEEVTEYVFHKELRSGDTFYWVTNSGDIDEFVLSKVVYHEDENERDFPYEVFIKDGNVNYSVGWIDNDAYGRYIFTDIEEARECARRCRM